jgi:hypothetical protein
VGKYAFQRPSRPHFLLFNAIDLSEASCNDVALQPTSKWGVKSTRPSNDELAKTLTKEGRFGKLSLVRSR